MSLLTRRVLERFAAAFFLCLAAVLAVLFMNKFLGLLHVAVMRGAPPSWIASCFVLLLPHFLGLTLPMAYLIGMMAALDRFSQSGELLALRSGGFSFFQVTGPLLGLGALLSGLLLGINHSAGPRSLRLFHERYAEQARKISSVRLESGTFSPFGSWRILARAADRRTGELRGVYLVERRRDESPLVVTAPRGVLRQSGSQSELDLEDGRLLLPDPDPARLTLGRFKRYRIRLPSAPGTALSAPALRELPSRELRRLAGDPAEGPQRRRECAAELALRSAAALAPLVFYWLAAPLSFQRRPDERARSFALGLAVLLGYYSLVAAGAGLARRRPELASLAPWLADAAGLAVGLVLTRRARSL